MSEEQKISRAVGVSAYIREQLAGLDDEKAIPMANLVQTLIEKFPTVKSKTGASARVNLVLKQKKVQEVFTKIKGKDKKIYIVRSNKRAHIGEEGQVPTSGQSTVTVETGTESN